MWGKLTAWIPKCTGPACRARFQWWRSVEYKTYECYYKSQPSFPSFHHSTNHALRPRNSPLPSHLGLYTCMYVQEALLVSEDRNLFVTPCITQKRSQVTWKLVTAINCLILYFRLFAYCFEKKISFSRYPRMVVQKSNIGHLNKIFIYKTLKLLRFYLASKGQERVKH